MVKVADVKPPPDMIQQHSFHVCQPPALKCCHLDVPAHVTWQKAQQEHCAALQQGLFDIEKVMASKKTQFAAGCKGLQAYQACAIQSYLFMVVKNRQYGVEASECAAEAQGFSHKWGARLV